MGLLITHPWLALVIAAALALLWRWSHSKVAAAAAVLWAAYAGYEYLMLTRLLCTGECDIRIDLLVIYPLLLVVIGIAVVHSAARVAKRRAA